MQLSKIIQSLAIRYVTYFNKKYERVGHLFQNRFLSKKVEDAQYLLNVCRYIHQNPYQIGIKRFQDYEWSSYNEYIKGEIVVDTKMLMKIFENSKDNFEKFHQLNLYKNNMEDEIEYEIIEKLSDEEVKKYIQNILGFNNIYEILDYNIQKRNEYLIRLANMKNVSLSQIARVLGINKKVMERVAKTYKENKK